MSDTTGIEHAIQSLTEVMRTSGVGAGGSEIGMISAYGGTIPPLGWLICDGSEVSRIAYAQLFSIIGTNFGAGDGELTFNLPDSGRVYFGLDPNQVEFDTIGKKGGLKSVVLTKNELPVIRSQFQLHGADQATVIANVTGDFTSTMYQSQYRPGGNNTAGAGSFGDIQFNIGNDFPHENLPPYQVANYIIRYRVTAPDGSDDLLPYPISKNASTVNPLPTNFTEVPNSRLAFNLTHVSQIQVTFGGMWQINTNEHCHMRFVLDGANYELTAGNGVAAIEYNDVFKTIAGIALAPGAHEVALYVKADQAGTAVVTDPMFTITIYPQSSV